MNVRRVLGSLVAAALLVTTPAFAQDAVTFGTNWLPQAESGGFYQALADGTYEKYGLKVTIVPGGPNAPGRALLMAGKIDFFLSTMIGGIRAVEQGVPLVEVAAMFQKEPQALIAHPDAGLQTFADLAKAKTIFLAGPSRDTFWRWIKSAYPAFSDEQLKNYSFSVAPFLADKASVQQGFVTSEPFAIEQQGKVKPKVFLLSDAGYPSYTYTIETTQNYLKKNPDIVQRFVDASIIGWYNYLYGNSKPGNDLIKKHNPEMTDAQIAYSVGKLKEHGILESGAALERGIGCMTPEKVKANYEALVAAGVVKPGLDLSAVFDTRFTCKKVGMDLKR